MKTKDYIVLVVAIVAIIIGTSEYSKFRNTEYNESIGKDLVEKVEIVKLDSLHNARFKILIDSLQKTSDRLRARDLQLDKFNTQLRTQNAKLEKIYNSLPVIERPNF